MIRRRYVNTVISDEEGFLLLQQRDYDKDIPFPGRINTIGGGMRDGESTFDAYMRETIKELTGSDSYRESVQFHRLQGGNYTISREEIIKRTDYLGLFVMPVCDEENTYPEDFFLMHGFSLVLPSARIRLFEGTSLVIPQYELITMRGNFMCNMRSFAKHALKQAADRQNTDRQNKFINSPYARATH